MQTNNKIGNVYATALIELAAETEGVDIAALESELNDFLDIYTADQDVGRFFDSPLVPAEEKKKILEAHFKPLLSETLCKFLCVLARRKRLDHLVAIGEAFQTLADEKLKRKRVQLRTPVELTERQRKALSDCMCSYLKATAVVEEIRDESLIGGMVIRCNDMVVNTSVKNSLNIIKTRLLERKTIGQEFYYEHQD